MITEWSGNVDVTVRYDWGRLVSIGNNWGTGRRRKRLNNNICTLIKIVAIIIVNSTHIL